MSLAFHLSGEHALLPFAEVESLFLAYDMPFRITLHLPPLLIVESDFFPGLKRLAFTHRIVGLAEEGDFKNILEEGKSFRVRCLNLTERKDTIAHEKKIANDMQGQFGGRLKADMRKPGQEIFAFLTKEGTFAGKTLHDFSKTFSSRIPTRRPFFHPSTMHPKLARCLVNLSCAKKEIFDPFCGSGALLIEAGLLGLRTFGMDMSHAMIEGAKKNLNFYGVKDYDLWQGDACAFSQRKFEAVVTDLPYGRSTLLSKERAGLYDDFFSNLSRLTEKAVVVLPENRDEFSAFSVDNHFLLRVHRSLNRHIYILGKA